MVRSFIMIIAMMTVCWTVQAKSITVIIPFSAGGATDQAWRLIQPQLNQQLHRNNLFLETEYVPGAGGGVGANTALKRTTPTLIFTSSSVIIAPLTNSALDYRAENFQMVSYIGQYPLVLFAGADLPSKWSDFVAKCRLSGVSVGNSGPGSMTALTADSIYKSLKCQNISVPYKSASQGLPDLMNNTIDTLVDHPNPTNTSLVREGKIQALMAVCSKRIPIMPEVPCSEELGIPTNFSNWHVMLSNENFDQKNLQLIQQALSIVLARPDVQRSLELQGMENISGIVPDNFLQSQQNKFKSLVVPQR